MEASAASKPSFILNKTKLRFRLYSTNNIRLPSLILSEHKEIVRYSLSKKLAKDNSNLSSLKHKSAFSIIAKYSLADVNSYVYEWLRTKELSIAFEKRNIITLFQAPWANCILYRI